MYFLHHWIDDFKTNRMILNLSEFDQSRWFYEVLTHFWGKLWLRLLQVEVLLILSYKENDHLQLIRHNNVPCASLLAMIDAPFTALKHVKTHYLRRISSKSIWIIQIRWLELLCFSFGFFCYARFYIYFLITAN